ncbi:MAG: tRNA (adenosine(37)-N6)-threonylcarbamoyltransferase complex dimerization subunit type 1 TsaB [Anaerolineae bacterium]|nr:tRNA (adenosine(37)-N6)-threonylcarbamoyltransferase complex dimerization subunit type 1 TsaB [Anaerolineae bacterium]
MMILAIDTATRWTGIALHDGQHVIADHGWLSAQTQSMELAPAVNRMLQQAGVHAADLSAIGIALGPGSYTGLRIGMGLAKGMALAYQLPLVGVPTLDIVAAGQPLCNGDLIAVAEAGRRRITSARYRLVKGRWEPHGAPLNETWDELLQRIEPPLTITGEISPAAQKQIRASSRSYAVAPAAQRVRRAAMLAELAWRRLRRGKLDDPAALAPIYLREP